jgi:hypothetical protein
MKWFKKILKLLGFFLFAILLSACLVIGVAPVLPKRKEQFAVEIKIEVVEKKETNTVKMNDIIQ